MVKNKFILILTIIINSQIVHLLELSPVEDNVIITTEAKIRDIISKILQSFNIELECKALLMEYYEIHNKLLAATLQSADNWIEVVKSANVTVPGDMIEIVKEVVNEITNYTDNPNEPVYEDKMIQLIDAFLQEIDLTNSIYGDDIQVQSYVQNKLLLKDTNSDEFYEDIDDESEEDSDSNEIWSSKDAFLSSGRRIYNGRRTTVKRFPFVAAVYIFGHFHCAGAVVSTDVVVTAASGVQLSYNNRFYRENPSFLEVRVGSSFHALGGDMISVINVHFYPSYNPSTLKDNICLLRLSRHINFKSKKSRVKKIEFDKMEAAMPMNVPNVVILGWGSTTKGNQLKMEGSVTFAKLSVYSLPECQNIYSKQYVTNKHFCAGFISKGGGACNQDVGDPAIYNGILYGIVSFGAPLCGAQESPTVFTKIGYYADWIETVIEEKVIVKKSRTSTTPYVVYMISEATSTRSPYITPIARNPPVAIADDTKESLREAKSIQPLNHPITETTRHVKKKHHKKHTKAQKKMTVGYDENISETTKKPHRHRHHHKNKKSKKRKKSTKTTKPIVADLENIYMERNTTDTTPDSDIETTTYTDFVTTKKKKKKTKKKKNKKTLKNILREQSKHEIPRIAKYKLRDLLRPKKPFVSLQAIKHHFTNKLDVETGSKKKNQAALRNNNSSSFNNQKIEEKSSFDKQVQNHNEDKDSNEISLFHTTMKNTDVSINKGVSKNTTQSDKTLILEDYAITPFNNKNTLRPAKHNKHTTKQSKTLNLYDDYYYDDIDKDHDQKEVNEKLINSYSDNKKQKNHDSKKKVGNEMQFSFYYDKPSQLDKSKNVESDDLYENYDYMVERNKPTTTTLKPNKKIPIKKEFIDYGSFEYKYGIDDPNKMYKSDAYEDKGHLRLPPAMKQHIDDTKLFKTEKPRRLSRDNDYYSYEDKPKSRELTVTNGTIYSEYEDMEKSYNDDQETKQLNTQSELIDTSEEKEVKHKEFKHKLELKEEFAKFDSHELKYLLKQVLDQPEGKDKTELLQELFNSHKKLGSNDKNSKR